MARETETDRQTGANPDIESMVDLVADNVKLRAEIERLKRKLKRAESLADSDPLCPLLNRRAFVRELEREVLLADRHNDALSVLYIDLDDFKRVNDKHGHEAGDEVLVAVAKILKAGVRRSDIVGRIGGDEFAIVLIRSNPEQTLARVETMRETLNAASDTMYGVTASIGAVARAEGASASQILKAADDAMFADKNKQKTD
ncbi:MAG: GGDEF domain-containing protein [Hyphomonadaceae bacterium]